MLELDEHDELFADGLSRHLARFVTFIHEGDPEEVLAAPPTPPFLIAYVEQTNLTRVRRLMLDVVNIIDDRLITPGPNGPGILPRHPGGANHERRLLFLQHRADPATGVAGLWVMLHW